MHSLSRIISPSLEELEKQASLSQAEWQILDFFIAKLAREWEIYVRPYMNGMRPDFVLLNPEIGIAVFKISSSENPSQEDIKSTQHLVNQWKNDILELYCPRLGTSPKHRDITSWVAVTAGVIFPCAEVQSLAEDKYRSYRPISFKTDIERGHIGNVFPNHTIPPYYHHFMTSAFADDLRGWLVCPDFSSDSIVPLDYKMLDSKQRELINRDRTASGYRRIRGAAGSGKSLVLAIRAAKLAIEGKKVLIASYNITLWHYLRGLIIRALKTELETAKRRTVNPQPPKSHKITLSAKAFAEYFREKTYCPSPYPQGENYKYEHFNNWGELSVSDSRENPLGNIIFTHFHYWCKLVCCYEAERADKYLRLFENTPSEDLLSKELAELALELKQHLPPNYDAILLDEGQDYQPLWWEALRKDLKRGGEVMLVADKTQDIYNHGTAWTEETMTGAGFTGRWNELNISYRMPENLRQLAEIFVKNYIKNPDKILPEARPTKQSELPVSNSILRWTQVCGNSLECCLAEIDRLMRQTGAKTDLANADIVICVDNIGFGIVLRDALRKKGVEVFDIFHDSRGAGEQTRHKESKAKKMAFYLEGKTLPSYQNSARLKEGRAAVKITTIHSFKGYEAPIMLLYLENSAAELFYVAFTRIKERAGGSIFSIICADSNFKNFGKQFPKYGGEFFDKTILDSAIISAAYPPAMPVRRPFGTNDIDDCVPF